MKSVLISIQSKWVEKIARGKKTIEVRKTRPKIETPFKCYIYCTKDNKTAFNNHNGNIFLSPKGWQDYSECNGKVIGEFVCDKIYDLSFSPAFQDYNFEEIYKDNDKGEYFSLRKTCLTQNEIYEYGKGKTLYGWHIFDLVIYDKPKELSEFKYHCKYEYDDDFKHCYDCDYHYYSNTPSSGIEEWCTCDGLKTLTRPPQSYCYVESLGE